MRVLVVCGCVGSLESLCFDDTYFGGDCCLDLCFWIGWVGLDLRSWCGCATVNCGNLTFRVDIVRELWFVFGVLGHILAL